jgi:PAS domain S-box-containing protein
MEKAKYTYEELEKRVRELEAENAKLAQSAFLFQQIFEKLPYGVQVFDKNGLSFKINEAQKKILGFPDLDEGVGKFNVLTDPFAKAQGMARIFEQVYKGSEYSHEFIYDFSISENQWNTRKDKVTLKENIFPVTDAQNQVQYAVALLSDITAQVNAETQFKLLVETAPEPIFIEIENKFVYVNKAMLNLCGIETDEELIGNNIYDFIHPDYQNIVAQQITALNENQLPVNNIEYKHLKTDGVVIDIEASAVPVIYNQLNGALFFLKDVTDRKKYEAKIVGLSNIIKNSLNEVYVFDTCSLNFKFINNSALTNLGYTLEEMQCLSPVDIKPLFTPEKFVAQIEPLLNGTTDLLRFETMHKRKDGTLYPVDVNLQISEYEGRKCFAAIITDITERKKDQDELKLRTEELESFFDCAIDLLCIANTDGYFLRLNKEWEKVLGYSLAELENKRFLEFVHPDDVQATLETMSHLAQQNDIVNFTNRYCCKNGDYKWIEWKSFPKGDKIYAAARDITEQKRIQDALLQKNMELESSEEEIRATNDELINTSEALKASFAELQAAKNILEENEKNLLEAQRISKIGNWYVNLATNQVTWSKACFWLFEIDPTTIAPENLHAEFRKRIVPEDIECINNIQSEAKIKQQGTSYEFRANINDTIRWFLIIMEPKFDAFNTLVAFKGTIQDITERKQFDDKLQKSYDLLNNLTAQVPGVVYQYRLYPDGRSAFPYSSPGMFDIYEVTSEEVRKDASAVFTRLHPDDLPYIVDTIYESARNQTFYQSEFRVILPTQGLRWRHCNANPQLMNDGSTLWHGIITDITDRKQAEEKIKEQQALFETIFNTITDAVFITDKERNIRLANKAVQTIFGYSPEEIVGKSTEIMYADKECFYNAGEEIFNEHSLNSDTFYLTKYIDKNSIVFPGETFGAKLYDGYGRWIGNLAVLRNVSERIKHIEALEEAREIAEKNEETKTELLDKLKEAQQIGKVGSWDWNLQTNEIWWSDELYKIFEVSSKTYIPSVDNNAKFIHPDDNEAYNQAILLAIETGGLLNYELRIVTPTGRIKNCKSTAKVFFNKKRIATRMSGTFTDITEQVRIKNELISAKEKAEESDRLKTAFLNNISHEIRTPMNAIVGFSGFLNDPGLLPAKREHFTDMIIQSSNQLLSIITDIISIATIEAGQERIFEMEIKLNATFKFLYAHFIEKAQQKKIALQFETPLPDDDDKIVTDKTKLESILMNLIGNALKFTRSGHVNCGYQIKDSFIEFYIEDTGIGIAPDMHDEIFKRFRQVEITANRKFDGSGLGLSISKAYVELLGGKIWLTSECGKGSTFYFTIPFHKMAPYDVAVSPSGVVTNSANPITILIAEDEDSNFIILLEMLSDTKINILRAETGLEAVNICKSNPNISIVLMDIKMPEMDGLEATREIKAFNPTLPIVAQTAYSFPEEKNQAFRAGCDLFLPKPIRKDELLYVINQVVK